VQCTKTSPEFECQGQRSKVKSQGHRDKKRQKCGILFGSRPLGRGPRAAAFFRERSSGARLRQWENQRMLSSYRRN